MIYAKLKKIYTKELERDPSNKELKLKLEAINSEIFSNGKNSTTINVAYLSDFI